MNSQKSEESMPLFDVEPVRTGKTQESANPFANAGGRLRMVSEDEDLERAGKEMREHLKQSLSKHN